MKKTPLYNEHLKLGAKIVDFGGWQMPVFYTNIIEEHLNTRAKAGLFDTCHMGEIRVSGRDTLAFLQHMLSNDISKINNRQMQYNLMCNESGGIVDDLMVYKLTKDKFLLVVNALNIEKDFNWLNSHKDRFDINIADLSDQTAKLDVQGPNSSKLIGEVTGVSVKDVKRFYFKEFIVNGCNIMISRSGYTAEDGFELYFPAVNVVNIWNILLDKGKEYGLKPIGLGARNSLRLEACYNLYGHESSEEINPFESGIDFTISFDKDFIGKQALLEAKQNLARKIVAFEMIDNGIPRNNYQIQKDNGLLGFVTSGTLSPLLKKGIGLGFVKVDQANIGNEIEIDIRGKLYKAKIVNKPIYHYHGGQK